MLADTNENHRASTVGVRSRLSGSNWPARSRAVAVAALSVFVLLEANVRGPSGLQMARSTA
jgi:hypothetical protein